MNRTSSSTNTIKFNYAQAAAQPKTKQHQNPHHQNQQQQQQQQKVQQSTGPSPNNSTSSANGKTSQKSQPLTNPTLSNGNAGRSVPENKVAQQKNPVTLPAKGHQWETNTSIQFGSINQPSTNPPLSSSPVQPPLVSGGSHPPPLPKSGTPTFGTVTARGPSEEPVQPTLTQPAVAPTGSGSVTGAPKPLAARIQNEIPRTQSAPPSLNNLQDSTNAKNVVQPLGHQMNTTTSRNQQLSAATPLQSIPTSNPPHHRKDSVSSTVSSNDGQQTQSFHPHQPQPHHNNYNQQHAHSQYHNRHIHHKPGGMGLGPAQGVPAQYHQRSRDKNIPGTIPPSSHSNPQSVPNQVQTPIQIAGPQPMPIWPYRQTYDPYYTGYYPQHVYVPVMQRPTIPVTPHMPPTAPYTTPGPKNHALQIINPADRSVVNPHPPSVIQTTRKDEVSVPMIADIKKVEDVAKEKEQTPNNDKKESKAVPIVDPIDKDKIEREKREREEKEQKEREESERKEREEKERLEREEKERQEREERERKDREEKERQEREERERKEREERERQEREERERKEREERERKEREEREERERKEREERERKEREERERQEREERERQEREKERKEREERERKEREEKEKERLEKERLEREEKERREREEAEQKEKEQEAERFAQEERERVEREEKEISEKRKREAEEEEKKKEIEKDPKKEEKKYAKGHKPEALDLSRATSAPPGPLSSARNIEDLNSVSYPAHIKSPNPALNTNSDPGKFKYDRSFLMQFMGVCKEKPDGLPALDAVGMEEPKDDKKGGPRSSRPGQRPPQHTKSGSGQSQFIQMGEFKLAKKEDDRFMASSSYGRGSGFGRSSTLGPRTGSGSMSLPPMMGTMTPTSPGRTQGGTRRGDKHKKTGHQTQHGQNMGQESVIPLEVTENRWVPMMYGKVTDDRIPMEIVQRKVKALLNKLTLEKFDSISDQIIDYANKSRDERDGRILREVISLTFDKSCDEPNFSQMYAQLCRKMMERVDTEIVDENIKNNEDKYVQGGALFRKYLLNRCQDNFEKGWKVNVPVPSNEKGEPDLMSDEYYTAAKAKRHGLGLIRFIGELFKLNMLTERIMHECIKKLLSNKSPEEEEMESLCKLLTTVGQQLDHANAKTHMDAYFARMEDMSKNMKLSSRIRFMIMDVIDLRSTHWIPRRDNNAPKTIAEIHEDAAKQKEEAEYMRRTTSSGGRGLPKMTDQMSRSGSGRRDKGSGPHGSGGQQADGWSTVGGGGSSSASRKAGDLSKFGSVRNKVSGNVTLTPGGGAFGGSKWKTDNKDRDDKSLGMARTNSASNTYSVLVHTETEPRKPSDGPFESQKSLPMERKKLQLTSQSKTIPEENIVPKSIMTKSSSISLMSEDTAMRKIDSMVEEYLNILDLGEVVICINELPKDYHPKAISGFADKVIEKKQEDVNKVINVFKKFIEEDVISKSIFMEGFASTMEFLMDIGTDAPKSYAFVGQLLYGSSIELKEVAELLKPLSEVDDKGTEKVMAGYLDAWKNGSSEQEIVQNVKDTGFDFKSSVFPKKSNGELNKFFEDHGLGSLKK